MPNELLRTRACHRTYRDIGQSGLHLGMAVGTQKGALSCLLTRSIKGPRMTLKSKLEYLCTGVEVMEMEGLYAPVVSAQYATSSRLRNEHLLHTPPALRYRFYSTSGASVVAAALEYKLCVAVSPADQLDPRWVSRGRRPFAPDRLESVLAQPMANRRRTPIQSRCDLFQREPLRN